MTDELDFQKLDGLIPAIVQDERSKRVLMMGYMNREAFERTLKTGHVTFYSRSRSRLWTKGETSGHFLLLRSISADCDRDALLVQVEPLGPGVCHEGFESCFSWGFRDGALVETEQRAFDKDAVYGGTRA